MKIKVELEVEEEDVEHLLNIYAEALFSRMKVEQEQGDIAIDEFQLRLQEFGNECFQAGIEYITDG